MIRDPRTPLAVGTLAMVGFALFLFTEHASPGPLSSGHAAIARLNQSRACTRCHTDSGLAAGCLDCHTEISAQLDASRGYHAYLLAGKTISCKDCHPDHVGDGFDSLVKVAWRRQAKTDFDHPHVEFALVGRHGDLDCDDCHAGQQRPAATIEIIPGSRRRRTFLGVDQACVSCHDDPHAGGLSTNCQECHGQEHFEPADRFDHAPFLALENGHAEVECASCHVIPDAVGGRSKPALTFGKVRGTSCAECHDSPHRVDWGRACESCHPEDASPWSAGASVITAEIHARAGFRLVRPHDRVDCEGCHPSGEGFAARFPDPGAVGYRRRESSCEGCHADAHRGQFAASHEACTDCHARTHFMPPAYGIDDHRSFPLEAAHREVACQLCHLRAPDTAAVEAAMARVRRFVGVPRQCKGCHDDVHGDQFAKELESGDCTECHSTPPETFAIPSFDHAARTEYALAGGHARADCRDCHVPRRDTAGRLAAPVRTYRGTSRSCSSCHFDAHLGQFAGAPCERCHESTAKWMAERFDHGVQSRFALDGTHSRLECQACHPRVEIPAAKVPWPVRGETISVAHFKPLGTECKDCHDFIPHQD